MNIIDAILYQCRINPALPAICAPGTALNVVSYGRLERFIMSVAGRAAKLGLTSGTSTAILCDDPVLHSALLLGLTHAGIATVSLRSAQLPAGVVIQAVISDRDAVFPMGPTVLRADQAWLTDTAPAQRTTRLHPDALCRLILTSGTTGNAKCVALTHDRIWQRLALHNFALGNTLPSCTRIFSDLGISTSLGFLFLIHALMRGGMLVWRGTDASQTMQAFGLYGVEVMIGSPAGLSEFLTYFEQSPQFGSSFKLIVSAGSRLSPQLAKSARARLCSNLFSLYGSTETSMVATAPAHVVETEPNAVGYVLPGTTVEIVSAAGEALPAGQHGRIRIRTGSMTTSYVGQKEGGPFRDGWFYPGDTGTLTADGLLVIGGRETAVINLGGDKINPETLEGALQVFPGVTDVAVYSEVDAMGIERLQIAVVADTTLNVEAFREFCARFIPAELIPDTVQRATTLARNAMGKLDRTALTRQQ